MTESFGDAGQAIPENTSVSEQDPPQGMSLQAEDLEKLIVHAEALHTDLKHRLADIAER